jgi:alkylated DNA repair dioxygenase AlkB
MLATNNLFEYDSNENLLPLDGEVYYYGSIFDERTSDAYLETLLESIPWKNDEAIISGKRIVTGRKVAWLGDARYFYTYSGITKQATPWTPLLLELKSRIETITKNVFNSCLLNLYHDGSEGMAWHSDDEKSLGRNTTIASISFGAERKFSFKHKITKKTKSLVLEHGSLLVMKGETQRFWQHSLLKSIQVQAPRVNLTFRTIVSNTGESDQ